ncbi:MAG: hypothetical protein KY468_18895 [Armatimonadetes bacterium]|nr:hypothetical protein [Armatimonadota bacterium]
MKRIDSPRGWTLIALAVYLLLINCAYMAYAASGVRPSPAFDLLAYFALVYLIGVWVKRDVEEREVPVTFDFGLYFYLTLPISILVYLYKSRGMAGGIRTLLGFIGLYIGTFLISLLFYYALLAFR